MNKFRFAVILEDKSSLARLGEIHTSHGTIQTPAFVPVGTQATVKSLTPEELSTLGVEIFIVNTYHAYLRPGMEVIKKFGGLHKFINWSGPLITDSGGFQVFSLGRKNHQIEVIKSKLSVNERPVGDLVKIDADGVTFTSHWDGSLHRFTPELAMQLQWQLGSDIHIAFDECAPYPSTHENAKEALNRTHAWARRCVVENHKLRITNYNRTFQALYGVVQGGIYRDLREQSADYISSLDIDGIAIGGVSVGESKQEMRDVCDWVIPRLPDDKPRHLLGVGEIDDIFEVIERGVDTFDCVQPTRLARMGILFCSNYPKNTKKYQFDIARKIYADAVEPIDKNCSCYTCTHFSRGYIHHLFRVRELLGYRLATIHNLQFINQLLKSISRSIQSGNYQDFKRNFLNA